MRRWLSLLSLCALLLTACSAVGKPVGKSTEPQPIRVGGLGTQAAPTAEVPASPGQFLPDTLQAQIKALPEGPSWASTFSFLDQRHGWLADGDHVLATDDGGKSWRPLPTVKQLINTLTFMTPDQGFVGTDRGLLATHDGGRTWEPVVAAGDGRVARLAFVDAQHGWIQGPKGFRRTADGGQTWVDTPTPCTGAGPWGLFSFTSPEHGWFVCISESMPQGETRELFATVDGGQQWKRVATSHTGELPGSGHATQLVFRDDTHGWLRATGGHLLRTTDGGHTWREAGDHLFANSLDLQFLTPQDGYQLLQADAGVLMVTHDGGATWAAVYPALRPSSGGPRQFFDADHGIAAYTAADPSQILSTADGGRTWKPLGVIRGLSVHELSFTDQKHGWAAGQWLTGPASWKVFATDDGGVTWTQLEHAPPIKDGQSFAHISLVDAQTGFVTGDQGQLFVTHDAGASFQPVGKPEPWRQALHFATPERGWETVSYKVFETTDGGVTWKQVPQPDWMHPQSFQVLPDGRLVMALMHFTHTQTGGILVSKDGGHTWTGYEIPDRVPGTVAFAPDGQHGWFTSGTGQFYTKDGGGTWEQIP